MPEATDSMDAAPSHEVNFYAAAIAGGVAAGLWQRDLKTISCWCTWLL
jgi:hypothetical protein